MQKLILGIPEDLHEALQKRREETGTPTSEFVRRVLRAALAGDQPRIEKRAQQPILLPVRKPEGN
jgi:hypothetical protein